MKYILLTLLILISSISINAKILHIGSGYQYTNINQAAGQAVPGDTILFHEGIYSGGPYMGNLQGTPDRWITIITVPEDEVIIRGGSNAWQISDATYLRISGFIFEGQTGNGLNLDDGSSFDTPAHNIIIENCIFRDINATGNNDELKLSGVDSLIVRNCHFLNGSPGGSLVDMVGCHYSLFEDNLFYNGGSNCIQAKGGTSNIRIERNRFVNGGLRSINIGGSTGLQFFRPQGVKYEASNIYVYSNLFLGSQAPIAYVGAVNCEVVNNTIITPDKWVIRI